jgi:hypothetical protein
MKQAGPTSVYLPEELHNRIAALRDVGVKTHELMVQAITRAVSEYEAENSEYFAGVAAAKIRL